MGWSFRKSIRLGKGIRLNVSKRGLGISGGVRGARISVGPSGTRFYGGWGPFRYVKSLSSKARSSKAGTGGAQATGPGGTSQASGCGGCLLIVLCFFLCSGIVGNCTNDKKQPIATTPSQPERVLAQVRAAEPQIPLVESASSLKPELAQAEAGPAVEAERDLEFPQRETRKWVDQTGKYTLIASLLTVDGDKVCLGKEDGSTVHVPIFRLSAADRQYVKEVAPTAVTFAKVVGVTDGDTVVILDGRNLQRRVRLEGIDAPESHQAFGDRARQALAKKVFQKEVRAETCGTDKYGRTLAHLYLDTQWINKELVAEGWAWHYKKYSDNKAMADAETQARTAGVGLWADSKPIPPWEFRRMPRPEPKPTQTPAPQLAHDQAEAVTEPQPKDVTVYVTNTGAKYHRDGCRYLKSRIPMSLSEAAKCYSPCKACNPPEPGEHRDATASHTSVPTYSSPAYSPSPSSSVSSGGGTVHVKGYYRKDGTYVRPHTRSRPRR